MHLHHEFIDCIQRSVSKSDLQYYALQIIVHVMHFFSSLLEIKNSVREPTRRRLFIKISENPTWYYIAFVPCTFLHSIFILYFFCIFYIYLLFEFDILQLLAHKLFLRCGSIHEIIFYIHADAQSAEGEQRNHIIGKLGR